MASNGSVAGLLKRLSVWVWATGLLLVLGAVAWWSWFYAGELGHSGAPLGLRSGSLRDALVCLPSSRGSCAVIAGLAAMGGRIAYNPALLWVGIAILWTGTMLRIGAEVGEWRRRSLVRSRR